MSTMNITVQPDEQLNAYYRSSTTEELGAEIISYVAGVMAGYSRVKDEKKPIQPEIFQRFLPNLMRKAWILDEKLKALSEKPSESPAP